MTSSKSKLVALKADQLIARRQWPVGTRQTARFGLLDIGRDAVVVPARAALRSRSRMAFANSTSRNSSMRPSTDLRHRRARARLVGHSVRYGLLELKRERLLRLSNFIGERTGHSNRFQRFLSEVVRLLGIER